jgi:hypothetical protein
MSHASGDFPDHWSDGCDVFTFQCDCRAEFEVDVIWSPTFSADARTLNDKAVDPKPILEAAGFTVAETLPDGTVVMDAPEGFWS